jgi:hypothetical protein
MRHRLKYWLKLMESAFVARDKEQTTSKHLKLPKVGSALLAFKVATEVRYHLLRTLGASKID